MSIGTSKGAFYEDEFRQVSAPWFIDPKMEGDEKMVVTPNQAETNKQLDDSELDPTTGMGIEVSFHEDFRKAVEIEDRRSEIPEWTMDRLMDPTPLDKSVGGENRKFGHGFLSDIKDPYFPSKLAKELGITDVDAIKVTDYFKELGIKPIEEDKPIKE
jgi:hypothetical protein